MIVLKLLMWLADCLALGFMSCVVFTLWPPAIKGVGLGGMPRFYFVTLFIIGLIGLGIGVFILYIIGLIK